MKTTYDIAEQPVGEGLAAEYAQRACAARAPQGLSAGVEDEDVLSKLGLLMATSRGRNGQVVKRPADAA